MTKAAKRSVGTKIKIGLNAIGDLSSIGSPSITQEEIDVTTLDSEGGYREFIGGFKDAGEVALSGFFVPGDLGQAAVYAALESGDVQDFEIIYPAALGATWTFPGIVTAYNVTTDLEEAIGFEATIRVAGKPTLNLSPSAGLSALSLTGTGGTLSPSFTTGGYSYTYGGVTAASVTVTATAANHSLKLYVDGAFRQNLTSGTASTALPLTTTAAKKLTIIAQEEGKSSVVYEVVVVKTS
ncbi:phage tail tube protein [Paenibacillus ginsengarvi]|uniref:Histidine kinase n=1 Tax=Paenibacillus ginsengarvi TaxID=400777 RepID=A0A3B0CMX2_9BACL|nr:phage tail tube protein [Paenibacillus ginsengarvi]RKN86743.1 histidine kinase [Paenibacillus ginsengarvi]